MDEDLKLEEYLDENDFEGTEEEKKTQKKRIIDLFKSYIEKAKEFLTDEEKVNAFLDKLEDKLNNIPIASIPKIGPWLSGKLELGDAIVMIKLVRSFIKKEYTDISFQNVAILLGALIYLAVPVDVIPDWLVGIGWVDDAAVIAIAIAATGNELDKYKEWEENK